MLFMKYHLSTFLTLLGITLCIGTDVPCEDDPNFTKTVRRGITLTCAKVASRFTAHRCNTFSDVAEACKKTCNQCIMKKELGQTCDSDSECLSGACKESSSSGKKCFASHDFTSHECDIIKHDDQNGIQNKIAIIFVGSGFNDNNSFREAATRNSEKFSRYPFFDHQEYSLLYSTNVAEEFCEVGCYGLARLLCCDLNMAKEVGNSCLPEGVKVQHVVIHNDSETYAGAAYRFMNVATVTNHRYGPRLVIHELGHSMFHLGDEYVNSHYLATPEHSANCDNQGCERWADVSPCIPGGCKNGAYYTSASTTFMKTLNYVVSHAQNRLTCCAYKAFLGIYPSHCTPYQVGGVGMNLDDYCAKDYQGFLSSSSTSARSMNNGNVFIQNPVRIAGLDYHKDQTLTNVDVVVLEPQHFKRCQLLGDYYDYAAAIADGVDLVVEVTVVYEMGEVDTFLFSKEVDVIAPPIVIKSDSAEPLTTKTPGSEEEYMEAYYYGTGIESYHEDYLETPDTDENRLFKVEAPAIDLVLDGSKGRILSVSVKNVLLQQDDASTEDTGDIGNSKEDTTPLLETSASVHPQAFSSCTILFVLCHAFFMV